MIACIHPMSVLGHLLAVARTNAGERPLQSTYTVSEISRAACILINANDSLTRPLHAGNNGNNGERLNLGIRKGVIVPAKTSATSRTLLAHIERKLRHALCDVRPHCGTKHYQYHGQCVQGV